MPSTNKCIIVIPAADQSTENQWMADNVDYQGGLNTFIVPLTSDGSTPTHYWCGGLWYDWQYTKLTEHFGDNLYADSTPEEVLSSTGLQIL